MEALLEQFFSTLQARTPQGLRSPVDGVLRVDLYTGSHTEHWLVTLRAGNPVAGRGYAEADTVWRSDAALFEKLVTGESQPIAALLRNDATLSGDVTVFLAFQRFFPPSPQARDPRTVVAEEPQALA
ncbi:MULTISPECIES: SCP2 sterol-binding domain-containing protein [unclassified Micromonospora]|uniref:SCP2 sterol-binding domain-containing protein n=1 Tax=unclassified Micromonospora TaxID=2617518 RepID=UPI001C24730C|nr:MULTISPECIES: SCP2 sterol-binding domain-containing protein [unclassified Micromonospora]MBU8855853.1 SCP2 sterol-binding domain-containing protein [Micromonospora sp. WMMB482]MDM4781455.1 SCP2 sterol-binding domain-containing protein [Micromonospora sp. b486]